MHLRRFCISYEEYASVSEPASLSTCPSQNPEPEPNPPLYLILPGWSALSFVCGSLAVCADCRWQGRIFPRTGGTRAWRRPTTRTEESLAASTPNPVVRARLSTTCGACCHGNRPSRYFSTFARSSTPDARGPRESPRAAKRYRAPAAESVRSRVSRPARYRALDWRPSCTPRG